MRIRISNMSDTNIALPSNLRHITMVLSARDYVIADVGEDEISTLRRLAGLGIVVTQDNVNVLGGNDEKLLKADMEKLKEDVKEKERVVNDLSSQNATLREENERLKEELEAKTKEFEEYTLNAEEEIKKWKAKVKEYKNRSN